jgi:hypothetical protein
MLLPFEVGVFPDPSHAIWNTLTHCAAHVGLWNVVEEVGRRTACIVVNILLSDAATATRSLQLHALFDARSTLWKSVLRRRLPCSRNHAGAHHNQCG